MSKPILVLSIVRDRGPIGLNGISAAAGLTMSAVNRIVATQVKAYGYLTANMSSAGHILGQIQITDKGLTRLELGREST